MHVGAIDIGTNSIRLLVAKAGERDGELRTLVRAGEPCRLGKGLSQTGAIDPEKIALACEVLSRMVARARHEGAERVIVAATQAIRSASNRDEVLERLGRAAGVPVRVLSGEEEAVLVYGAVVESLGALAARQSCVVFDLGGGSTEVVSGVGRSVGRTASLPIGAVSLTERFLGAGSPTLERISSLDREVERTLHLHCRNYPSNPPVFAGVGGTVTVLASLFLDLKRHEPARIDGTVLPAAAVESLVEGLTWMSLEARRRLTVMGEGRADIVAAGARVVLVMLRFFRAQTLTASSQGLRYALARLAVSEAGGPGGPRAGRGVTGP